MFDKALAGIGHADAAAIAIQQILFQLDLKQADLAAQGWLGNRQQCRRFGEAAQFGDMQEIIELFDIHGGVGDRISKNDISTSLIMLFHFVLSRPTIDREFLIG